MTFSFILNGAKSGEHNKISRSHHQGCEHQCCTSQDAGAKILNVHR